MKRRDFNRGAAGLLLTSLGDAFAKTAPPRAKSRKPVDHAEEELNLSRLRADRVVALDRKMALVAYDCDKVIYPASLTKLLTGCVLFEQMEQGHISLQDLLLITPESQRIGTNGNHISRIRGSIPFDTALPLIFGRSYNDITYAVAQHISNLTAHREAILKADLVPGTEHAFVMHFMRPKAEELGLQHSEWYTSHGLPPKYTDVGKWFDPQTAANAHNRSSLLDLERISRHAIERFPNMMPWFGKSKIWNPGTNSMEPNTNPFIGHDKNGYEFLGMKTGLTNQNYCLILWTRRGGDNTLTFTVGHKDFAERSNHTHYLVTEGFKKLYEMKQKDPQIIEPPPLIQSPPPALPLFLPQSPPAFDDLAL